MKALNTRALGFSFCSAILWLGGLWFVPITREFLEGGRSAVVLFLGVSMAALYAYASAVDGMTSLGKRFAIAVFCPSAACAAFLFLNVLLVKNPVEDAAGGLLIWEKIPAAFFFAAFGACVLPVIGFPAVAPLVVVTVLSHRYYERMMDVLEDRDGKG